MYEELANTYKKEWDTLFYKNYSLENLRASGIKGKLNNLHFRSICWKIFLECIPEDPQLWNESVETQRKKYDEILDKFQVNPRMLEGSMDISVNNPLSQSQQSPWNQYFQDSELKVTVQQDVVRTFPEIEFFRTPKIQEMMINILFSYAREYPHVSYRQGMHELLAPIIYVLHHDQQAYLKVSKTDIIDLNIRIMLNQNYIEHDAFSLFCHLMSAVEAWYTVNEPFTKFAPFISSEPFTEDVSSISSLGLKLKNIYKHLLKQHDLDLFSHLEQMEITPQIYGIRWLRLLFGREFPFCDLLIIWDAIFACGIAFDLVDYIFVAMLIAIKDLLLKSDYASCLRHLMQYPNITDIQYIIDLALSLRNPNMPKPEISLLQNYDHIKEKSKASKDKHAFVKTVFPKNVFSSQLRSMDKTIDSRPRSLKIPGVNSSISGTLAEHSVGKVIQDSENNEEICCGVEPSELATFEEAEIFQSTDNVGNYNTFPRASIRNVMESKNVNSRNLEVSQTFGHVIDKRTLLPGTLCKEMVSLMPNSQNSSPDHFIKKNKRASLKDKSVEVIKLKDEYEKLKMMNEYCAKQITQHITKLQECMIQQTLLYEDEMFLALAGLKRARDILKGTVPFSEEVANDDISNYPSHVRHASSTVNSTSPPSKTELDIKVTEDSKLSISSSSKKLSDLKVYENCDKHQDFITPSSQVPVTLTMKTNNCLNSSIHSDLETLNIRKNS